MSISINKNLIEKFDSIKVYDEIIIWTGKPKFIPFILSDILTTLFTLAFGIIWILFNHNSEEKSLFSNYFWLIGIFPISHGIYEFTNKIFGFFNTVYCFSNKRAMMKTGFFNAKTTIIDIDKISDIEINVNFIGKLFNAGTIMFYSGKTKTDEGVVSKIYDKWVGIENPYEVYNMLSKRNKD